MKNLIAISNSTEKKHKKRYILLFDYNIDTNINTQ